MARKVSFSGKPKATAAKKAPRKRAGKRSGGGGASGSGGGKGGYRPSNDPIPW